MKSKNNLEINKLFYILLVSALLLLSLKNAEGAEIKIEKDQYLLGETVNFEILYSVENPSLMNVEIIYIENNESFKLFGETSGNHQFIPDNLGTYEIIIKSPAREKLKSVIFEVTNNTSLLKNTNFPFSNEFSINPEKISTDKKIYVEGETVLIRINEASSDFILSVLRISDDKRYDFLGEYSGSVVFIPEKAGEYAAEIRGNNGEYFSTYFNVSSRNNVASENIIFSSDAIKISDSKKGRVDVISRFYAEDSADLVVSQILEGEKFKVGKKEISSDLLSENSFYDADFKIRGRQVQQIKISSLKYVKGKSIGIDEYREKLSIDGKNSLNVYAINFEELEFAKAEINVIATGTELYECKLWNFTARTCEGTWNKKMNLIPGEEYNFSLTPGDPGYAETGVASINTLKSIYEPGETSQIVIVVIGRDGYLVSGAQIELNITSPDGYIKTLTSNGDIFEKEKGIYFAEYKVQNEGNYLLSVHANGTNVDYTMLSYFKVSSSHEFDIIRTSPFTTDPFRNAFNTEIKVIFRTNVTSVNLTEKIPIDFTLIDAGTASITQNDQYMFLHYDNLQNNSIIHYTAQPPLTTPELWVLGNSWIDYNGEIFVEARPWYLAVDPSAYYDPNLTISGGWSTGSGATFTEIDDGIRYPSSPDTNNYIASIANSGQTANFGFPQIKEAFVDNITLWVYTGTGTNAQYNFNLYQNGTSRCSNTRPRSSAAQWYNCTWTAPTGDFSNLSLYLSAVAKSGGGAATSAYVYASYLEVGIGNYPPNVILLRPTNASLLNVSTINFNFSVSDDRDTLLKNCTLWSNFTGAWLPNYSISNVQNGTEINMTRTLTDGNYIWNVQCYDQGNKTSYAVENWTLKVNSQAPLIKSQAINTTILNQSNSVRFNVSISDFYGIGSAFVTVRYPNSSSRNFSLQNTADEYYFIFSDTNSSGLYNLTLIWANDTLGRIAQNTSPGLSFTVLLSPPQAFNLISPNNNNESRNLLPLFAWSQTQDETFANYTLLIDKDINFGSPDFKYYTYEINNVSYLSAFALDANVEYYWKVIASDYFGTTTNSTETFKYITDRTAPSVLLESPAINDIVSQSSVVFEYTPSDSYTLQACFLYTNITGTWASSNSSYSISKNTVNSLSYKLSEGYILWNVNCSDSAGNSAFASENRTLIIDLTGPNIQLIAPANYTNITNTNIINFTANASDLLSDVNSCSLIVNNQIEQTKSGIIEGANITFTQFLSNGVYNWSVNCTDFEGIESGSASRIINITSVDADVPLIRLNYPDTNMFVSTSNILFNYTPEDATGIQNCSLYIDSVYNQTDFNVENLEDNYFSVSGLSEEYHKWNVSCYDNSSYFNAAYASKSFTVDLTNPTISLNRPYDNSALNRTSIQFNYTPNDTNIVECQLWGNFTGIWGPEQSNSSSIINGQQNTFYKTVVDGKYIWNVKCIDKAGRSSFYANNYSLIVDTKAPAYFGASSNPASPTNYSPYSVYNFNISFSDAGGIGLVIFESNFTGSAVNTSITENAGLYNFSIMNLSPGFYRYKWYAVDTAGNLNSTTYYTYTVNKGVPSLALYLNGIQGNLSIPEDTIVNATGIISMPSSGLIDLYSNQYLINSGTSPLINITNISNPGIYNITLMYGGDSLYYSSSKTWFIDARDNTAPQVSLLHPENNSFVSTGLTSFQYVVNDFSPISSCNFYINNLLNDTKQNVQKNDTSTFQIDISSGTYTWRIECNDSSNNKGISSTYNFSAIDTTTINLNLTSSRYAPERGEKINISTKTSDVFGGPLIANVKTDIIQGFSGLNWWNSTWKKRKALYINETQGRNHINELAEINITGLNNSITDCQKELRIVYNQSPNLYEIPFKVYSGDNSTWCYIAFIMNISANAVNQNNYYVYYNNSAAQNPGYNVITNIDTSFFAQNSAADEGTPGNVVNIIGNNDTTSSSISVSGGGAGSAAAHGRDFINTTSGNTILKVQARYRFEVTSMAGNWYLRYSTNSGTLYSSLYTGVTAQGKTTTGWSDITGAYPVLNWTEINNTRLQGRVDKGSGSGTSTMLLYWVELNVTSRIQSSITQGNSGTEETHIFSAGNLTDAQGYFSFEFDTRTLNYSNYSIISSASKALYSGSIKNITIQIVKDVTPPNITLVSPDDLEERGEGWINFTYVPYDINLKNCTLYVYNNTHFVPVESNLSVKSGVNNSFNGSNFAVGLHIWNVLCYDTENNSAFAPRNFTLNISAPNLRIRTSDIYFNNDEKIEGTNLTVYANISNAGLTSVNNSFTVQFFDGDPDNGGIQIGSDFVIENLTAGAVRTIISKDYIVRPGRNVIFVKADAYNTVNETTGSDNKAGNNVSVALYQYYYGNVTKNTALGSSFSSTFLIFENSTIIEGSIYFADADSSFSFSDLQALTRNTIGQLAGDDLTNLDSSMGTTSFDDSIKTTWGGGTDNPLATKTFNISDKNVADVPVVNSTISDNFVTGILWDTADDTGNLQYDETDREDVVFISNINPTQIGEFGTYDSEVKIPATLRNYKEGDDRVVFYVELK